MFGRTVHISLSVQVRRPVPAPPLRPAAGGMRTKGGRRAVGEGVQGFLVPLRGPEQLCNEKSLALNHPASSLLLICHPNPPLPSSKMLEIRSVSGRLSLQQRDPGRGRPDRDLGPGCPVQRTQK